MIHMGTSYYSLNERESKYKNCDKRNKDTYTYMGRSSCERTPRKKETTHEHILYYW